jgi:hypothetical protein
LKLEEDFHNDLQSIQKAKEEELVSAGLNPDGGVPVVDNRERVAVEDERKDKKEAEAEKVEAEQSEDAPKKSKK